ncbi:MAG: hypothetical protein A2391_00890 [Candidatus Brennerbacteria bacterium RIFOXYB1_FULL_41_13]|nr:MAG: hypothetical protein A2391_00890 [Candidatus Brennerbacteria bacterium RIFOXYB1_FULL_41_13]
MLAKRLNKGAKFKYGVGPLLDLTWWIVHDKGGSVAFDEVSAWLQTRERSIENYQPHRSGATIIGDLSSLLPTIQGEVSGALAE